MKSWARLHDRGGAILADGAGEDDEGDVEAAVPEDAEGRRRAQARQAVVGDDHVPWSFGQGAAQLVGCLHATDARLIVSGAQLTQHQLHVVGGVLHQQHAYRLAHVAARLRVSRDAVSIIRIRFRRKTR
jgi:hypothetical protein